MADPFEVRIQFTKQLQRLNASETAARKAAIYALKHKEMDEDLHSCIMEQLNFRDELNRADMNIRANIMYFIKELCVMSKESQTTFIERTHRDRERIVDAVAPPDGSGAANVKVVVKILKALEALDVLKPSERLELEERLKGRDINPAHPAFSDDPMSGIPAGDNTPSSLRANGIRLDKRQIEQRIEEDRERHKRLRESIWAVSGEDDAEFSKLWDEGSDIADDDLIVAKEDAEERRQTILYG